MKDGKEIARRTVRFSGFAQGAAGLWMPRRHDTWETLDYMGEVAHNVVQIKNVTVNPPLANGDFTY